MEKRFEFTDYIITPRDLRRGVLYLAGNVNLKNCLGVFVLVLVLAVTKLYLSWELSSALFFIFLVAMVYWSLDSGISIAFSLVCLAIVPLLFILYERAILFDAQERAEQAAIWTFYFLVAGIAKQIWELRRDNRRKGVKSISEVSRKIAQENIFKRDSNVPLSEIICRLSVLEKRKSVDGVSGKPDAKRGTLRIKRTKKRIRKMRDIIPIS